MSQKTVQLVIGRLLTDEDYRRQFMSKPQRFLTALRDGGLDVTESEIAALLRTDRALWTDAANRVDSDLQRTSLRSG